jgi:hypothetical protein
MSRTSISRLVKIMFALLILAFLYIAFQVAFSPRGYRVERSSWQDVIPGTAQMIRRGSEYVWVVRYANSETTSFSVLNKFVIANSSACSPITHKACEFSGAAGEGIVIRYLEQRPARLSNDVPWFKGFTDPTSGAYYDRFGRLYRDANRPQESAPQGLKMLLGIRLED